MIYASLCKRTYKTMLGFPPIHTLRMDNMRSHGIAVLLLLASAGILSAQFTITNTSLPNATNGSPYSAQLTESGAMGTVTWSIISGALPAGLTLNSSNGVISGIPTAIGSSFEVEAEFDSSAPDFAMKNLSILVLSGCTPTLSPVSPLPQADIGIPYTQHFTATCSGPYTFSEQPINQFVPNTLPPGLSMTSVGIFKGTPMGAGTFSFFVTITDQNQNQTQFQYSLTINTLPTIS